MSMIGYAVSPELVYSTLGRHSWTDRIPNVHTSMLTELEIEALLKYWQESRSDKTHITPIRATMFRLIFFAMRKATADRCAKHALFTFRPTEEFVNQAVDRFKDYLLALPSVPDARKEHIDKIKKLGRLLWVRTGVLDVRWQEFLRAQCIVERDDLD